MELLGPNWRVRFARLRALIWVALGVVSFPLGWANSVVLVWIASVYANVESGIAAGEAADNQEVMKQLARMEAKQRMILTQQAHIYRLLVAFGQQRGVVVETFGTTQANEPTWLAEISREPS